MDDDSPCVLVRTDLRMSTYQAFARAAKARGVEIGTLLSELADRAVVNPKRVTAEQPRRPRRAMTDELREQIRGMNAQGMSDGAIARALDMPQPSVSLCRRTLGLTSPSKYARKAA